MPQHNALDYWLTRCVNGGVGLFHSPRFWGLEHLDASRPLLLVANHSVYGVWEAAVFWLGVYVERGIALRTVSDHFHFRVPLWREVLTHYGGFDGTPANCARLLAAGERILVHPGGGREVAKRKGEKYRLMWKDRLGFIRLAIAHGCPIVAVAAVGGEDVFDIVLDADEVMGAVPPLAALVDWMGLRRDLIVPLVRGIGPTPIPRPERLYFKLSAPIDTTAYGGDTKDLEACRALRRQVQRELQAGIEFLRWQQAVDPHRTLRGRLTRRQLAPRP
jgi:1-acyl-sn-glycerol-3-phosphate acyltransferase